jgi:zinc D-Ala-D-Ala dipeptidase
MKRDESGMDERPGLVPGEPLLIADPKVLAIPIQESGEPLVDLLKAFPSLSVDKSRSQVQKISGNISRVRQSVAERLVRAQSRLPKGFRLRVKEGHRPLDVQEAIFEKHLKRVLERFPELDLERAKIEASRWVAPPNEVPPHSTGGAIDLTLMDSSGQELDLGTEFNASPIDGENLISTLSMQISGTARLNRKLLIDAMVSAGFVNYPTEWWHWSFGDRYWAYWMKEKFALYGSVNE